MGSTKMQVTPLALGTLTMGPFQLDLPLDQGAGIITDAVRRGVNLIDAAKAYVTYPYVGKALAKLPGELKNDLHVIGRSYDYSREGIEESFKEALTQTGLEKLSIYMLHEQESELTLRGHREALEFLGEMKQQGKLLASGISTHYVAAVRAAALDPLVDVIFAILNREGLGIIDGTRQEMEEALAGAARRGKGILLMKALGGGHLYRDARGALEYARDLPFVHSIVLGMQDMEELNFARSVIEGKPGPKAMNRPKGRKLFVEPWCCGCGRCVKVCPFGALSVKSGRAVADPQRCVLCSYCAGACPDFLHKGSLERCVCPEIGI